MADYNLYYLYKKQRRPKNNPFAVYEDVVPNEYSIDGDGTLETRIAQANSVKCGYQQSITPQYKWVVMDEATNWLCEECDEIVEPTPTYRWLNFDTICSGTSLYNYQKKQESYNNGSQWVDVLPPVYQIGSLISENSAACTETEAGYHRLSYKAATPYDEVSLVAKAEYFEDIKVDGMSKGISSGYVTHVFGDTNTHQVEIKFKNGLTSLRGCFQRCPNLVQIPADLFSDCSNVTDITDLFDSCSGLVQISPMLLSYFENLGALDNCFYGCSSLAMLPAALLTNCPNIINIKSFNGVFAKCSSITYILEGFLDNCVLAESFYNCFANCTSLVTIPSNLFASCKKVTNFSRCFIGDTALTSQVPIDDDGSQIYNRQGKAGYANVTYFSNCFADCTNMIDYGSIPSTWK